MKIKKSSGLKGKINVPPSKSHTMRAIIFASLAKGVSKIENYLDSPDTDACINACELVGAKIKKTKNLLKIEGTAGKIKNPEKVIDVKNSGILLRFLSAIAGNSTDYTVITGDESIKSNRIMQPMIDSLNMLGAVAVSLEKEGFAPLCIKGPIKKTETEVEGSDSQHVSALLILGAISEKGIKMRVKNPGELPWADMTLHWFDELGVKYENMNYTEYLISGNQKIRAFEKRIPADFSSAAFPIAAALVTEKSEIELSGLDMKDCQGDKKVIDVLKNMDAEIEVQEKKIIAKTSSLKGTRIDANNIIDAVPVLSVIGLFAEGTTEITNAGIAKTKECNRLKVMEEELSKFGAKIRQTKDGLEIEKSRLSCAKVNSHNDHRVAMSLCIAGLNAEGKTELTETECVQKTFPEFFVMLKKLGAY